MNNWKTFSNTQEIRSYVKSSMKSLNIKTKKEFCNHFNISVRTLFTYESESKMPNRFYNFVNNTISQKENISNNINNLEQYSDGDIINELIRRGIKVSFN